MSYVTCRLAGQMGNQLYQIATASAYAWDHNLTALFPDLLTQNHDIRLPYNRERIFFRCNAAHPPHPFKTLFKEKRYCSAERPPFHPDLILEGHFQSWRHFDHHREKIQALFAPSSAVLSTLQTKYAAYLSDPKTVGLHIRTHTKRFHDGQQHRFLGDAYYRTAIDLFPPDSTFVVVSDRIAWCKTYFPRFNRPFTYIEGNDHIEDFFLLTLLSNLILSNSTYSWWSAYLNLHPAKKVIAPHTMVPPSFDPHFPVHDFFPLSWILAPVDWTAPYPTDLEQYPSQSMD